MLLCLLICFLLFLSNCHSIEAIKIWVKYQYECYSIRKTVELNIFRWILYWFTAHFILVPIRLFTSRFHSIEDSQNMRQGVIWYAGLNVLIRAIREMELTTAEPFRSEVRPCSEVDLTKALALLGFGSWTALESSKFEIFYLTWNVSLWIKSAP